MSPPILSLLSAEALETHYRSGHWRDRTIYQLVRARAETAPEKVALRDRRRHLTCRQMVAAADGFAAELARRGVVRGDRVAFWMPDRIESVVVLLACSRNGYVVCPSPHRNHTVADVVRLLERMRATAFLYQAGFGADAKEVNVADALAGIGSLRHVRRFEETHDSDILDLPAGPDAPPRVADPNSVIYIAFTSGSTGQPKGVMHSDNTLLVTARGISTDWHIGPDSVVYSLSPFSHNLGIGALLTAIHGGAEYVIHDIGRGHSLVDRLVETGTTYLVGVPTHAMDLLAELQERGVAAPSYTTLKGAYCLRVAISNHRSRFEDFDLLVDEVLRIGRALLQQAALRPIDSGTGR